MFRRGDAEPGVADGKLYVRTDASTGKVKRSRNDPRVVVAPCSFRGKPKRQAVAGLARILPESEHPHAGEVIAANWSRPMRVLERSLEKCSELFHIPMAYIEITPVR